MKMGGNYLERTQVFKNILVPIDGSAPSIAARDLAVVVAKKFNSHVTVIYVVSHELMEPGARKFQAPTDRHQHPPIGIIGAATTTPPTVHAAGKPDTSYFDEAASELTDLYREEGEDVLDDAVRALKAEGITAGKNLVMDADPANAVLKVAKEGNYDAIIMGASGEKEKKSHLGSVAKKVAHKAEIPVLIARGEPQISKILVAVNGSAHSRRAVEYATLLASKTRAPMTLLHVQETSIFRLRPEVSKEIGKRVLAGSTPQIEGIEVDQKMESGDPAKTILNTANKSDCDLIIVGARGHSTTEMFMLGGVSDHIVQYADRSVLIIK
jgi:nucleotide-binding universal stress UspA family protein